MRIIFVHKKCKLKTDPPQQLNHRYSKKARIRDIYICIPSLSNICYFCNIGVVLRNEILIKNSISLSKKYIVKMILIHKIGKILKD